MLYPFVMKPYYKDYIWGGRNLERYGKRMPEGNIAESWEVSARDDGESMIANGCWEGKGLRSIIEMFPEDILGKAVMTDTNHIFPLLFKLIDANEALSVQVHPGDAYALACENEPYGKHEAWYILEAAPDAGIIYGLLPNTNSDRLKQLIRENRIRDCLNSLRVRPGDVIDIMPGMIHAIGKGIVLAEIQQNSNLTYRIYDYERKDARGNPRELHIEKALEVIDYSNHVPSAGGIVLHESESTKITSMLRNKYFQLDILDIHDILELNTKGDRFYILFIAQGDVCISYDSGSLSAEKGVSILIPASLGKYEMSGICRALMMCVSTDR